MEAVSDPSIQLDFDFDSERANFRKTFQVFATVMGDRAFGRANKNLDKVGRSFSIYHYEAFTIGVQTCIDRINSDDSSQLQLLQDVITDIKLSQEFVDLTTGGGKNSPGPLRDRISYVQERIEAKL